MDQMLVSKDHLPKLKAPNQIEVEATVTQTTKKRKSKQFLTPNTIRRASLPNKRVYVTPVNSKGLYAKSKGQTSDTRPRVKKSYGRKMKNWRTRIKEAYFDPSLSMEVQLNSLPEELTKRHWRRLLEYWSRERVKAMSDKNKANRANKKLTQLTGKKTSFGREPTRVDMFKKCFTNGSADGEAATKQMKELKDKHVDGQTDTPGPDDVFSQVIGPNNSGSAQTYGLGIRAKDLWGVVPGRPAVRKENAQLKSDKAELENENSRIKAQLAWKNNGSGVENEGSGHQDNGSVVKHLKVRDEVYVKSITNNKVARGKLVSMDPTTVVLQTELGAGWCEVELQVAIERNEVLFRPYEHMRYIHDVINTSTAWPTALIEVADFDD
ncbi:uncharacterized protein [Rutidosis leptorrhynchoides]|uniref:uncharacterized protein n=1 Tax=Rutidosis leptorrhynchoides TaxID=125765 RepID=UPI003A999D65